MDAESAMQMRAQTPPLPNGVIRLEGAALVQRRRVALAIMLIPFAGTLEAMRLILSGAATSAEAVSFAVMYFVHMGGVTMGLHRLAAHRSFRAGPIVTSVLTAMGSTAGQGPVLFWVATHRAHHAHSDSPGDPHSPNLSGPGSWGRLRGFWHGHMGWMLSDQDSRWGHWSRDVLENRSMMFVHRTYFTWLALGLILPGLAGALLHQSLLGFWLGFIFGGLTRMFFANQAAWLVGSLSHLWGGRVFETGDRSVNNWLVAVLAFGEGLQNNHHAFPSCYRHAIRWWEPDLSGWCLFVLRSCRLIHDTKFPSAAAITRAKRGRRALPQQRPASI